MKFMETKSGKIALYGILGALCLVLNVFDSIVTPVGMMSMGVKLGLSNIVIMVAASMSASGGLYILALKVLFVLVTRGTTAGLMSLSGGLLATSATIILLKVNKKYLSYFGISIIGAILHNAGQLCCACLISGTVYLLSYGSFLMLFAVITGSITGIVLNILMPRLFDKARVSVTKL